MRTQLRASRRQTATVCVLVGAVLALVVASLCIGALPTAPTTTVRILLDGHSRMPTPEEVAILHFRVPRTIVIALVGAALGVSGALVQGLTRNTLADPGLLGISAGASLAVVVGVAYLSVSTALGQLALAFIGAAAASVAVFALGGARGRGTSPITLVIAGATVSAFLVAVTTTLVLRSPDTVDRYRFWTTGSVAITDYDSFVPAIGFLAVGFLLAVICAPGLNLLTMGDHAARSLGLDLTRTRILTVVAITLLAGAATAIAGPIAFLGLTAPHLARTFTGPDYRWAVPVSALCATAVLYVADIVGRVIAFREIPAGIMMVVVGVPFFLAAVRRSRFVQL
ncbi:ABC transporter permease [Gordonia spumicola]|uniref:ABC transporter permease n=1 Tax=Gordonia spumicola TaxID=589161 RepID=A0A7I9V7I5_9ACTN|nr:iron ABC transporter permease [Gordonia spumicola]GEE01043.1 ABC transporter permease [Gordonia spumicola]